jgi:hypothetical protein
MPTGGTFGAAAAPRRSWGGTASPPTPRPNACRVVSPTPAPSTAAPASIVGCKKACAKSIFVCHHVLNVCAGTDWRS